MAQLHELGDFRDLFHARRGQNQGLAVARCDQIPVGFLDNLTEVKQQTVNIAPCEIVGSRMAKYSFESAEMTPGWLAWWNHNFRKMRGKILSR